jgi:hypothetical protein
MTGGVVRAVVKSAETIPRKVGVAAPPEVGPANTVLAVWVARVMVKVPAVVTGEPETVKIAGAARATDVTVPDPDPPPISFHTAAPAVASTHT